MRNKKPTVTIIMPTFNSENTIEYSLKSIRAQNYPKNLITVLVVDGGSTDNTKKIARKYNCTILENKKTQQEFAKHIGILRTKERYAMFLDSDEALKNPNSLKLKVRLLEENPKVKFILSGGYKCPKEYSEINNYINTFGDPFAFFMYRKRIAADSNFMIKNLDGYYETSFENNEYKVYKFKTTDILPLSDLAAGVMLDLDYLRSKFPEKIKDASIVPEVFYIIATDTKHAGIVKKDTIIHNSATSLSTYLNKIRWRVKANIHYQKIPGVGFSNRENYYPKFHRIKKYLFFIYAFSIILPLIDGICNTISHKQMINMLHLPLTLYTAVYIIIQYTYKIIGKKPIMKNYGGNTKVLNL